MTFSFEHTLCTLNKIFRPIPVL